jgi:hypothetical protein
MSYTGLYNIHMSMYSFMYNDGKLLPLKKFRTISIGMCSKGRKLKIRFKFHNLIKIKY